MGTVVLMAVVLSRVRYLCELNMVNTVDLSECHAENIFRIA